jgi:signal transduction histidine kinase
VTRGDLDARAEVQGSAEQQEVASAFNEMTGRLSGTLRAQREFVANASHQLRTPLTGLRLRLEAAALKSRDPEVEHELTAAERETERLARLLSELLMLAGERERPSPQPVDLGEATSAACARWRGPAERSGHRLRLEEGDPAEVAASEEDVAAMLDNLLENALNYSPSGTEVTIGWRGETGVVRIEIADQGPGIDEHEHERLFERFYRGEAGRAAAAGTGLGLSVVEALANRWTGRARLTNRHEGGALAELTLPAYRALPNLDPPLERALPGRG